MFEVGTGKADITANKIGVGMMGYGMHHNIVLGVDAPIYARAFVFRDSNTGKKLAYVVTETGFVSTAVKRGVVNKFDTDYANMGYTKSNLFLTAQHTHSAPGGYFKYALYNMSIPGFVPEVYDKMVEAITEAILQADKNLKPASLKMGKGSFASDIDVAFNRSIKAYNLNPEVSEKLSADQTNLAVDREMKLLRIDDENGKPMGSVNWFGVHPTSISNDNHLISGDNKGFAATYLEEEVRKENPNFIGAFAQGTCGDVTPNYIWDKKKNWTRGPFEDDFESAKYNGKLQFEKALEILNAAKDSPTLPIEVDYVLTYADFRNIKVDPEFAHGDSEARTGPSCHGLAFFKGTAEGPGMPPAVAGVTKLLINTVKAWEYTKAIFMDEKYKQYIDEKYKIQGVKDILIETGDRKMLGTHHVKNLFIPGWADRHIGFFKKFHKNGSLDDKPWVPQVLPLHIAIIGNVALAGFPAEITTIAGKRLRQTILDVLKERGIEDVILCPYANSYCGYITTYEEYQIQCYEGGHTVYGEHTLGAFQTKFKELAKELLRKTEDRNPIVSLEPVKFDDEEILKRTFDVNTQKRLIAKYK